VPVSGTVTANAGTGPFPVSDNAGSLTVDGNGTFFTAATSQLATAFYPQRITVDGTTFITSLPVNDNAGSLTVDSPNLDVALSTRLKPADTLAAVTSITNVVHVDDNAGSLTIDNANLDATISSRLKPADTLTGVTTVAAVTAITNALPAGTNRLGSVRPVDSADADLTAAKGTQTSRALGTQDLKDSGRVNIMWTAEFAATATSEALLTLTESRDGGATSTFTTKVVTSGKRLRICSIHMVVESGGSTGTALQRAILRMRFNTAGAVIASSPLQGVWEAGFPVAPALKGVSAPVNDDLPDSVEFLGDGTKQIGFTLTNPDWVVTTQIPTTRVTVFAYEY
jgi:hypothetical protein